MVVKTSVFRENKALNIVNVELKQLQLLPFSVTLCFSHDNDLQTGYVSRPTSIAPTSELMSTESIHSQQLSEGHRHM